jgi:hypothetical protein
MLEVWTDAERLFNPIGRMFVRAVGMLFDKYLAQQISTKYSKLL